MVAMVLLHLLLEHRLHGLVVVVVALTDEPTQVRLVRVEQVVVVVLHPLAHREQQEQLTRVAVVAVVELPHQ
jgi:hypothetical protein